MPLFASLQEKSSPAANRALTENDGCGNNLSASSNGIAIQELATEQKVLTHTTVPIKTEKACKEPKANENADATDTSEFVYKVFLTRKADLTSQKFLGSETLDEPADDPTAQETVLILTGKNKKKEDPDKRKAAIANVLGKGKDAIAKKFLAKLTETNAALKLQDDAQPMSIETAIGSDFHKALAYLLLKRINNRFHQKKSTNAEGSPKQADSESKVGEKKGGNNAVKPVCSNFLNQTACNNGKNCKRDCNSCNDTSILINEKLVLMAAAIVSLLEFYLSKDYCSN
uniref:Variant surface glycoprotein 1125.3173 n=1 Tax=Trypanosoma brucei TaxID=5691 RepID=A0A1J0R9L3_9TRYP|nr:variant surface glycoprotein 1125.3173 [Trypanosoma brucei]